MSELDKNQPGCVNEPSEAGESHEPETTTVDDENQSAELALLEERITKLEQSFMEK